MAVQLERVGGVKVRMRRSLPSTDGETKVSELLAYVVSVLVGLFLALNVTGPLVARWLLGQ